MSTPTSSTSTMCKPHDHDFVPKKQIHAQHAASQTNDITEVFCRKCGTVCFLTPGPVAEPSRIAMPVTN